MPVYLALAWRFWFLCDDAFISFRYARHLAEGRGLVFNLGRSPPVEGYSNFLWVLWCALFEALGVDVTLAARLSSVAAGAVLLGLVLRSATRALGLSPAGAIACGLFLATLPPMGLWATGGLETMPMALAGFLLWERLLAEPEAPHGWTAGAAALGAGLLRADGVLWCGMIFASWLVVWLARERPRPLLRAGLQAAAILCAGWVAHLLWRHSYYGEWVPQTARVKVGFSLQRLERGGNYLATFLLACPAVTLCLLSALRRHPRDLLHVWLPGTVVWACSMAYVVWIGGDFMPMGRFLFPAVPFSALLFALVWRRLGSGGARARLLRSIASVGLPLLSLFACWDLLPVPRDLLERFHFRLGREWRSEIKRWEDMRVTQARWSLVGRALALHTLPGESILLAGLGAQAYPNELFVYDNYGLVTPEVVAAAQVRGRATPGHDLQVPPHFFFPPPYGEFGHAPTYLGAMLVADPTLHQQGQAPWWAEDLPPGWEQHPYSRLVRIEEAALPAGAGFPQGARLRLLRFVWAER